MFVSRPGSKRPLSGGAPTRTPSLYRPSEARPASSSIAAIVSSRRNKKRAAVAIFPEKHDRRARALPSVHPSPCGRAPPPMCQVAPATTMSESTHLPAHRDQGLANALRLLGLAGTRKVTVRLLDLPASSWRPQALASRLGVIADASLPWRLPTRYCARRNDAIPNQLTASIARLPR